MSPAASSNGPADVTPAAMAASKLGMIDKLLSAIEKQPSLAQARDGEGMSSHQHAQSSQAQRIQKFPTSVQVVRACTMQQGMVTRSASSACWRSSLTPLCKITTGTLPYTLLPSMAALCQPLTSQKQLQSPVLLEIRSSSGQQMLQKLVREER